MTVETVADPVDARQVVLEYLPPNAPTLKYLEWAQAVHGSPPVYHLACMLVCTCYELVRRGFRLPKIADSGDYPLSLWFALIGDSGTGKSTAINAAQDFIRDSWQAASFSVQPEISLVRAELDDSAGSCDRDGLLDAEESGTIAIEIVNRGAAPLTGAVASVEVRSAGVTFPDGARASS